MATRPKRRLPPQPSPLTPDQVYRMVTEFAATTPLTTAEIAEFCRSRHPDMPGVTTRRVNQHLQWLQTRHRVVSWSGRDREELERRGVDEVQARMRYWALPDKLTA